LVSQYTSDTDYTKMAESAMQSWVIVAAAIIVVTYNYLWNRRVAAPLFREVLEGARSPSRGALFLSLSMPTSLVFLLAAVYSTFQQHPAYAVMALFGLWLIKIGLAMCWIKPLLAWQIAHPSTVAWWQPIVRGR
jgi:hypothetical protein